jgi:hypothetical protein
VIPLAGVGHSFPVALLDVPPLFAASFCALLNSFALDYMCRQKLGGINLTFGYVMQLPVPAPSRFSAPAPWDISVRLCEWIGVRVLELTYVAADLAAWGRDLGWAGPPFRWDSARRARLRAELDAAFFQLYELERDEASFVLETFPIVRKNDEVQYGDYRTKRLILDVYDEMTKAIVTGIPYKTILAPAPADPELTTPPTVSVT